MSVFPSDVECIQVEMSLFYQCKRCRACCSNNLSCQQFLCSMCQPCGCCEQIPHRVQIRLYYQGNQVPWTCQCLDVAVSEELLYRIKSTLILEAQHPSLGTYYEWFGMFYKWAPIIPNELATDIEDLISSWEPTEMDILSKLKKDLLTRAFLTHTLDNRDLIKTFGIFKKHSFAFDIAECYEVSELVTLKPAK